MQSFYTTLLIGIFLLVGLGVSGQSEGLDSLSRGERLFQEAEILEKEKKWEEAIEKYDEAGMMFLEKKDTSHYVDCIYKFNKICANHNPNKQFEFYRQKINQCKNYFGDTSPEIGIWFQALGRLHLEVQQLDSAAYHFNKSLAILQEFRNWKYSEFQVRNMLGVIDMWRHNYKEAKKYFEESRLVLDFLNNNGEIPVGSYIVQVASIYANIGQVEFLLGNYEATAKNYNKAIKYAEENKDYLKSNRIDFLARGYFNMGNFYNTIGKYAKAEEYMLKAVFHFSDFYDEEYYWIGTAYDILGIINQNQQEYEKAIGYWKTALNITIKNFGYNDFRTGLIQMNIGDSYLVEGNYNDAESYYRKAKINLEKNFLDPNPEKVNAYFSFVDMWLQQEIKLDSAATFLIKAETDLKILYGKRHPKLASLYSKYQKLYLIKNNFKKSLEYAQKSFIANSNTFSSEKFYDNPKKDEFVSHHAAFYTLLLKTRCLKAIGKKNSSDNYGGDLAKLIISCFDFGNKLIEDEMKSSNELIPQQNTTAENYAAFSELALHFYYDLIDKETTSNQLDKYLFWMEKTKSQELLFSARKAEALSFSKIPLEIALKERETKQQIADLEQMLFTAIEAKDSVAIDSIQSESLFKAKREHEYFINNLESTYPDYFQLKYDFTPVRINELERKLDGNTLFLELSTANEKNAKGLYYLALDNNKSHVLKTDLLPDLSQKITTLNKLLRSHNLLRADRRRKFIKLSHELYQQFIQPIEHLLEGKERLVIVGEGVTHYLPFEVLLKSNEDKPWHELDFLIKDHEISYHYSGTLFARAQEQKANFDNELLAFAPVFSDSDNTLTALREGGLIMADTTFRSVEGDGFSPLPHSKKEVKNIQKLFPKSAQTTTLLGKAASEKNLKSALEQNHRFVHIASHSFANIDYPNFSGIACASDSTSQDGILYVGEIYNLAVNSDLVVLSSCESGVGKLLGGEGMLGLNRSFVYAGVPNVIFSLWKVYDEMTGDMMTEFYKNTLQGQSYSKALRAAKLKMLEDPKTAAPDIWAAFLLVGR